MAPRLHTIIGSTRPGRVGASVAAWFHAYAEQHALFKAVLVDLKTFDLPVFVAPEYNYGPSPALLNALDYVYVEWNYKPASFVSYGDISGGLRGVQMTKQTLAALKMVPIVEAVSIPMVENHLKDGRFQPTEDQKLDATRMLDALARWTGMLKERTD